MLFFKIIIFSIIEFLWMLCLIDLIIASNCSVETCNSKMSDQEIMADSFACSSAENVTLKPIALCSSENSTKQIAPVSLRETRCYCDPNCHIYDDCCIDWNETLTEKPDPNRWSCRKTNSFISPLSIYMVQKCADKNVNPMTRILCEEEAFSLKENDRYYNHLQSVPVHSNSTNIIYRNIYCAICNNDSEHITAWKTFINCSGLKELINPHLENSSIDFLNDAFYDPEKNRWSVNFRNRRRYCRLVLSEFIFSNWTELSQMYGARLCKPAISSCLPNVNSQLLNDCQSYTSYVYKSRSSSKVNIYKNFHCALCNNVFDAVCYDPSIPRLQDPMKDRVWLPLLFDFNFVSDNENQLGLNDQTSRCNFRENQVWDPLLKQCLNISCGRMFQEENGKCIPINVNRNSTESIIENDCWKVILPTNTFFLLENGNIYVNHTGKSYSKGQYEIHRMYNNDILEILICDENALSFEFPALQAWFSELTLGLSVTCLLLHLLAYSLLPTLRNCPGKILMSLSLSLICGHLFFLLGSYFRQVFWLCYLNAILMFLGYLSSFFWMNVMAIDIFRTFAASKTKTSSNNNKIFVRYSIYAWLSAVSIVLIAFCVDQTLPANHTLKPKFASRICWFNTKKALLIFFILPVTILLVSNFLLFGATALSIRRIAMQVKSVNKFTEKKRFVLYIKLAIVFGLTWFFGFLGPFTEVDALWYPFIVLNGLQGAMIFVIFTIKRKIIHMLIVKLKIRSQKYSIDKKSATKAFYRSLSNLTTLQTSLTSTLAPAASGSPGMLVAVRQLHTSSKS